MKIIHFNHNDKNNLNIGDQAHVHAIQEVLSKISGDDIEFIERSIQLMSKHAVPSKFYYPKSKHYPMFIQNIYRSLSGKSLNRLIEECNEADLVLIGGGGVFMSYLFPLNNQLIDRISKPIVMFGVGYNHNLGAKNFSSKQLKSVKLLGGKSKLLAVRDQLTVDFLSAHDVKSKLMCDPAIFLSETDPGIVTKEEGVLNIGINMARHGWNKENKLRDSIIQSYADLILNVKKARPTKFYYFMHQPNELLYVKLLEDKGVVFDGVVEADSHGLKGSYGKVDLSISMMLHSTILAFGAGTPSICVGYDKKNLAFMDLTGQADRYISVDDLTGTKLTDMCISALSTLNESRQEVVRQKSQLESVYLECAHDVVSIAKS